MCLWFWLASSQLSASDGDDDGSMTETCDADAIVESEKYPDT